MTLGEAKAFLIANDLVYGPDDEVPEYAQTLNMSDTWAWGTAWGEYIPDDQILIVVSLIKQYGWPGALYWMSERHDHMRSEFADINRFVEFVRHEEALKAKYPNSSERAYVKYSYTLGE